MIVLILRPGKLEIIYREKTSAKNLFLLTSDSVLCCPGDTPIDHIQQSNTYTWSNQKLEIA